MALTFLGKDSVPNYLCLSTDIGGETNQVVGAAIVGGLVMTTDEPVTWYMIQPDLTLAEYTFPIGVSVGDINIGEVSIDQATPGTTNGVVVNAATIAQLPAALAANGGMKVEGVAGGVAVPVSGTVTANAGTNLNTSALALETGGNLAEIKTNTDNIPAVGQAAMAASTPVVIASDQSAVPVSGTFYQATQPVSATQLPAALAAGGGMKIEGVSGGVEVPVTPHGLADEIIVAPTLTVAGAYVSGDYVGTSTTPITFTNCARVNGGTGTIVGAALIDSNIQSISGELWLFDATVAPPNDNAAWQLSGADMEKCIGVIPFSTYYGAVAASGSFVNGQSIVFKTESDSRNLYGCFVTRGTPTHTSGALKFKLRVWQD